MDISTAEFLSMAQAAEVAQVSVSTLRRWFDADQPTSGEWLEQGGRTGGRERRVYAAWARSKRSGLGAASTEKNNSDVSGGSLHDPVGPDS